MNNDYGIGEREIKFRAWDGMRKRMFTHPDWVEFIVDKDGILKAKNNKGYGEKGEQKLTIMQYTGLKDRNGEEIFEGDVVKCLDVSDQINFGRKPLEQIEVVRMHGERPGFLPFIDGGYIDAEFSYSVDPGDIEVIGDIFQTPELIPKYDD